MTDVSWKTWSGLETLLNSFTHSAVTGERPFHHHMVPMKIWNIWILKPIKQTSHGFFYTLHAVQCTYALIQDFTVPFDFCSSFCMFMFLQNISKYIFLFIFPKLNEVGLYAVVISTLVGLKPPSCVLGVK